MAEQWEQGICNDRSGFLFNHPCDQLALNACVRCAKPVCSDHSHHTEEGVVCTSCAKREVKQQRRRGAERTSRDRSYYDYDDPYFYGGWYYGGWGSYGHGHWGHDHYREAHYRHDEGDFTEADAGSLAHQGDEDFESDMGES